MKCLARLCLFFIVVIGGTVAGQNDKDFVRLTHQAQETLYRNPDEAIGLTQNLLLNNRDEQRRAILYYVMAEGRFMQGNYSEAIQNLSQASELTRDTTPELTDLTVAASYYYLGLKSLASELLSKYDDDNKHTPNGTERLYLGLLYRLKAQASYDNGDYNRAKQSLTQSNRFVGNRSSSLFMLNQILLAEILLKEKVPVQAEQILTELKNIDRPPFIIANIYKTEATLSVSRKEYGKAYSEIGEALTAIKDLGFNVPERDLLQLKAEVEYNVGDTHAFALTTKQYRERTEKLNKARENAMRSFIELTDESDRAAVKQASAERDKQFIIVVILCLLPVGAAMGFWLRSKFVGKELKKQYTFLDQIYRLRGTISDKKAETKTSVGKKRTALVPLGKEEEILRKLETMEDEHRYMEKNMSLPTLAAQLDINTKYLSEIINRNKGKNFNTYINELRIRRIAFLLKTDPRLRQYKISYLADMAGFTSHSNFATVFKSITGMTPNAFLKQINEDHEE